MARLAQVVALEQYALDDGQQVVAGGREARQPLAGTREQGDAELVFQLADLPAHAGLGRMQRVSRFGEVEAAAHGLAHGVPPDAVLLHQQLLGRQPIAGHELARAELLEIHLEADP